MDLANIPTKSSEAATPLPKRIIVCCDGTWQSAVSGKKSIPSNVTRLCRHLARAGVDKDGKEWQQVVYYDSGVGTGALLDLEKKRQGASGAGLAINVIEAYNFIVLNYSPGDEIFCFGFSRGAYTARAVAGMVTDIGVCEPRQLNIFPEVYAIYQENRSGVPFRKTARWKAFCEGKEAADSPPRDPNAYKGGPPPIWEVRPHGEFFTTPESRNVKVVGVWDTVGALGVPDFRGWDMSWLRDDHGFHNVHLNKRIANAFQALALDERRTAFAPTVWSLPPKTSAGKGKPADPTDDCDSDFDPVDIPEPNLLQVWFPGVHINIGGGSDDLLANKQGDLEQIASITFAWMVEQVSPFLAFERHTLYQAMREHEELLMAVANERVPPSMGQRALRTVQSWVWSAPAELPLRKLNHGWATGPIIEEAGMTAFPGQEVRRPLSTAGTTNEQIHPTVAYRAELQKTKSDVLKYEPKALMGWKRRKRLSGPGFEYYNEERKLVMPEYKIAWKTDHPNLERLIVHPDAAAYLKDLDRVNFSLKNEDFEFE